MSDEIVGSGVVSPEEVGQNAIAGVLDEQGEALFKQTRVDCVRAVLSALHAAGFELIHRSEPAEIPNRSLSEPAGPWPAGDYIALYDDLRIAGRPITPSGMSGLLPGEETE